MLNMSDPRNIIELWLITRKRAGKGDMSEAARALGVSYSTLQNWKHGRTKPPSDYLLSLIATTTDRDVEKVAYKLLRAVAPLAFGKGGQLAKRLAELESANNTL